MFLVICPPCVVVTSMEPQKSLRDIININFWVEICRTCTCLFLDFWKTFPQVGVWSLWGSFLSSHTSSSFLFSNSCLAAALSPGPLKNLRGLSSVSITRHSFFSMSENLVFKELAFQTSLSSLLCHYDASPLFGIALNKRDDEWHWGSIGWNGFRYLFNGRQSCNDFTNNI